jgi:hypothetical protein
MLQKVSLPPFQNVRPWSFNNFWHWIMENPETFAATLNHNPTIILLSSQQWLQQHPQYVSKMSIHRGSITFGLAGWKVQEQCGDIEPVSIYQRPFWAECVVTTMQVCPKYERQRSVNDIWLYI